MKKTVLMAFVLLAMAGGLYLFFSNRDQEKTDPITDIRPERPRARTRAEIKERMRAHLEKTKEKAKAMREKIKGMRGPLAGGYFKGQAQASYKSITKLDKIIEKSAQDEALTAESRQAIEESLSEAPSLGGASLEQATCISDFCRVVLAYKDDKAMDEFLVGTEEHPLMADKYRFDFTQSKITVEAGKPLPKPIPMETRFYYSNTQSPLPMDEELQSEPEV